MEVRRAGSSKTENRSNHRQTSVGLTGSKEKPSIHPGTTPRRLGPRSIAVRRSANHQKERKLQLNRVVKAVAFQACLCLSLASAAQEYPSRPIKMQIAFATGGATDVLARLVSEQLAVRLGQPVVSENRPGAATAVAAAFVARSKPDGYTLLFSSQSHAVKAATEPDTTFDAVADFSFVGKVGQTGLVLMANPDLKVHDLQGLLALGRSDPTKLKYASSGTNTSGHLWTQSFFQ